jgi:hypothetical protein
MFRTVIGVALALFLAAPASASPFTWLVKGQIHNVQPPPWGTGGSPFTDGDSFSWWITMESTSPDYYADPGCGLYAPITAMRFTSGSVSLSISTPGQDYFVNPGTTGFCEIPDGVARIRSDFDTGLYFAMHFWGDFASDALPVNAAIVHGGFLDFSYGGPPGNSDAYDVAVGTVSSITSVPEPAELLLLAGGVLAAVRRIRVARGKRRCG